MNTLRLLSFGFLGLLFAACKGTQGAPTLQPTLYNITEKTGENLPVSSNSSEVEAMVAPYKAQLDAKMNRQLAVVKTPMKKSSPEGELGNWMADIMVQAARDLNPGKKIAFAATNPGGLRLQEIGAGPLLVSEVYELMPFDNKLVVLDLSGAEVREFIAHMTNSGGWPVSQELTADVTSGKLVATINGQLLDDNARYLMATIDYVANGGSRATMLKGKPMMDSGRFLRDILVEYAEKTPVIDVKVQGNRMRL